MRLGNSICSSTGKTVNHGLAKETVSNKNVLYNKVYLHKIIKVPLVVPCLRRGLSTGASAITAEMESFSQSVVQIVDHSSDQMLGELHTSRANIEVRSVQSRAINSYHIVITSKDDGGWDFRAGSITQQWDTFAIAVKAFINRRLMLADYCLRVRQTYVDAEGLRSHTPSEQHTDQTNVLYFSI